MEQRYVVCPADGGACVVDQHTGKVVMFGGSLYEAYWYAHDYAQRKNEQEMQAKEVVSKP